ncbi:MAG: hypothetical protein CMJ64_12630 [Planctomycetaceae bacterium]|nr:hypothetical protein [Planctomycetaceae bacterium]
MSKLKRNSEELLQKAVEQYEQTGDPQRLFTGFDYQAGTWQQPRWVVVKCEANAQGTNRRMIQRNGHWSIYTSGDRRSDDCSLGLRCDRADIGLEADSVNRHMRPKHLKTGPEPRSCVEGVSKPCLAEVARL